MKKQALLIGIDPLQELADSINHLKKKIFETCGYQQQVDEPPHYTFVVNNFSGIDKVGETLRKIANDFSPLTIEIDGINHFPPKQSGTYMTYAGINKTNMLEQLQKKVVIETSEFRQGCLLKDYLQDNIPRYTYTPEELNNIDKYGYLYVGKNWVPHMSIAILDRNAFNKIGRELENTKLEYRFNLDKITLFTYSHKWITNNFYNFKQKG